MNLIFNTTPLVRFPDGLDSLALRHFSRTQQCETPNHSVLESLALICSQLGVACKECLELEPSERFSEELATVALQIMDLALRLNTSPSELIERSFPVIWQFDTVLLNLTEIQIEMARWIASAQHPNTSKAFELHMSSVLNYVLDLAQRQFSLEGFYEALYKKVADIESRGVGA